MPVKNRLPNKEFQLVVQTSKKQLQYRIPSPQGQAGDDPGKACGERRSGKRTLHLQRSRGCRGLPGHRHGRPFLSGCLCGSPQGKIQQFFVAMPSFPMKLITKAPSPPGSTSPASPRKAMRPSVAAASACTTKCLRRTILLSPF